MERPKVAAVSLFSGAGGLDIGSHEAGVPVVAALDFEADAIATLRANALFEGCHIHHADLAEFDTAHFAAAIRLVRPEAFVVIGGPPCQPFSKNGYWVRNENRLADRDPRNMIEQFFRVIAELRPDGFLLENVESILHPTNAAAVESIKTAILELGYSYTMVRANAADYGVPQRRKRVFFIGSRRSVDPTAAPRPTHRAKDSLTLFDSHLPPHPGVGPYLEKFAGPEYFEPQEVMVGGTYYEDLLKVPPGKNYLQLTAQAGYPEPRFLYGARYWSFLLKLHPDGPSWTIPAHPGPWVGPFHWTNRRLRVPEIAAIQTFPERYVFRGSRRSVQKQIGNAVPPLLGKAMVSFLVEML